MPADFADRSISRVFRAGSGSNDCERVANLAVSAKIALSHDGQTRTGAAVWVENNSAGVKFQSD
ncbi:hypothetical protein K9U39_13735 [Rhodoblastus acidophilus]|uniref:Uncharacterized protein n=1 Tax=Candidatus Rhodoblastus alkanivorans TaxID=2954117 RepID=A0ABS9ZAF0_9HYPH|nr:hypothetical protein [Candidatus Rhodoblastus alkanivorans]MCI4684669.1 hypothetical protein [Candidatus Rhodoblastus alkanivorans]MDI4641991.1 hypothetical protein [Rhodoblastus acidophilus]